MNFKEIIIYEFKNIIEKYNMHLAEISENEIVLYTDKYFLSLMLHSGEVELYYYEKQDKKIVEYIINSFIAYSISAEDRNTTKNRIKEESNIQLSIALLSQTLDEKWSDLLQGGKDWISKYKEFILYIPERDVTEYVAKKYKEVLR